MPLNKNLNILSNDKFLDKIESDFINFKEYNYVKLELENIMSHDFFELSLKNYNFNILKNLDEIKNINELHIKFKNLNNLNLNLKNYYLQFKFYINNKISLIE